MSTTTPSTPEVKSAPLTLTPSAVAKVKEIMAQQSPVPGGLRVGVVGGGCSGFSYSMQGATVDYVESLEGAGFKFENPNVKSTCGCGSSFNA